MILRTHKIKRYEVQLRKEGDIFYLTMMHDGFTFWKSWKIENEEKAVERFYKAIEKMEGLV